MQIGQAFNPYRLFVGSFIPNALMRWNGVSPGAKLAYARLAQFAGEDGECFPAQETLAAELGVCPRQARRHVKELIAANLLRVQKPRGRDRLTHKHNRYEFIWHPIFASPERTDVSSPHRSDLSSPHRTDLSSPSKENHEKEIHEKNVCEGQFQTFWEARPPRKNDSKEAARKAWHKAIRQGAKPEEIIAGQEAEKAYHQRVGTKPEYVKHRATWLNNACWLNDYGVEDDADDDYEAKVNRLAMQIAAADGHPNACFEGGDRWGAYLSKARESLR